MSKWSEELKEMTRQEIYPGAMMKDENYNFGFYFNNGGKAVIKGVDSASFIPVPTEEIIATFGSVMEMVDAGWVMD